MFESSCLSRRHRQPRFRTGTGNKCCKHAKHDVESRFDPLHLLRHGVNSDLTL